MNLDQWAGGSIDEFRPRTVLQLVGPSREFCAWLWEFVLYSNGSVSVDSWFSSGSLWLWFDFEIIFTVIWLCMSTLVLSWHSFVWFGVVWSKPTSSPTFVLMFSWHHFQVLRMEINMDYCWMIACELVVLVRKHVALICGSLLLFSFYLVLLCCLA